jgi:hypothetical protein
MKIKITALKDSVNRKIQAHVLTWDKLRFLQLSLNFTTHWKISMNAWLTIMDNSKKFNWMSQFMTVLRSSTCIKLNSVSSPTKRHMTIKSVSKEAMVIVNLLITI